MMNNLIKLGVVGSRDFGDYEKMKLVLDEYKNKAWLIVSGGARGADSLSEKWASENNMKMCVFPAEWDKYGKRAGFIRNEEIVKYSDQVIAFWDGNSRGTAHTIGLCKKLGKEVRIIRY
jgi:hypothetical protein